MLGRNCSNPNIILRDGHTLELELALDSTVASCRFCVTEEDGATLSELVNASGILTSAGGLLSAEIQLAQGDAGNEDLVHIWQLPQNSAILGEEYNNDVGVE